mmetsp:Transcript_27291/g.78581  ORF Transcript_27291/g.78581 Transcript_27291/m.78581 type:complete len:303 (-) Transcript_27291:612-1520(-)
MTTAMHQAPPLAECTFVPPLLTAIGEARPWGRRPMSTTPGRAGRRGGGRRPHRRRHRAQRPRDAISRRLLLESPPPHSRHLASQEASCHWRLWRCPREASCSRRLWASGCRSLRMPASASCQPRRLSRRRRHGAQGIPVTSLPSSPTRTPCPPYCRKRSRMREATRSTPRSTCSPPARAPADTVTTRLRTAPTAWPPGATPAAACRAAAQLRWDRAEASAHPAAARRARSCRLAPRRPSRCPPRAESSHPASPQRDRRRRRAASRGRRGSAECQRLISDERSPPPSRASTGAGRAAPSRPVV